MKLVLLCVGKLRGAPARALCEDYAARLARYGPFELREVKPAKAAEPSRAAAEEGARLREALLPGDTVWILDERGAQCTSVELARKLSQLENRACRRLVVVLGGAYGLDPETKRAGSLLGLSKLTFNHELCRAIALEQLYRARTIQRGEPYHH
ncbi:MAG: 23S rRNA (pseudouridine(1915)-N(3))-methyltransferase RlmH [Planctomycetota bacterium]|nr:23S rRNA (pseudouridine(1915)-N(3))-methyltransferase RlmH [Planctomycetota bacterium]